MAEPKTKATDASVDAFLKTIKNEGVREDCRTISAIMEAVTKAKPTMWGTSIVGFGTYHYVYASGREGDWPLAAFSPRKANITIYLMAGFAQYEELLKKLGPHSHAVSCLYIKRLSDVHIPTLKKLITLSVKHTIKTQGRTA